MGTRRLSSTSQSTLSGRLRAVREGVLWLLRLRTRHRVVNCNMEPTASSGDYVLVNPDAYRKALPKQGDVVIARHPWDHDRIITKRVQAVAEQVVELASDNSGEGQDSREFGPLPVALLCGQVTCIIR